MKRTSYQISINTGRTTTTKSTHASLVRILSFLLFLSCWRALKTRSNHPKTVWITLELRHLNSFKNSFKETCKYAFHSYSIIGSSFLDSLVFWISDSIFFTTLEPTKMIVWSRWYHPPSVFEAIDSSNKMWWSPWPMYLKYRRKSSWWFLHASILTWVTN